ncbi:NADH dehydrogenase subunit B [Raineyella antarctica]|uniref:NADH dehydrogenase subunit B n=1 Tax=Raineyella antarctica TaxID=1577474 RepID=A0A1G6GFE5_9ACTN|nr:NADH-quinone oxidoreductase subunit B [Raineyella antarctica]SDB80694.1 NADH dehydrogenase subunit B [Raineyella antarctica]
MAPVTRVYDWYGDGRLLVADLGLACCTLEFEAATLGRPEVDPAVHLASSPAALAVVVSGTVPDALVPVVHQAVAALGRETGCTPAVVAYGACASSGGPYWDSYAVADGISQFLPVAAYVPGCPPPPGSLEDALAGLVGAPA